MYSDFVHLHLHTDYSLLDGAIKIDELIEQASYYNMPAVAITDHGNLFGAVEFYKKALKAAIKPIIGCEVYVAPNSRFDRSKTTLDNGLSEEAAFHLILLAKDAEGYKNLTSLVTKAYLEGFYYKPRIDKELLKLYSGGLIGLTSCLKGEVPYYLSRGQLKRAEEVALEFKQIFGVENFFFEIQHNGIAEQEDTNKKLIELSKKLQIPLVATNDCHYLKKDDAKAHDILLCIQTGKTVKDKKRLRMLTDEFYFKSPQEMKQAFHETPEAVLNTRMIAERCNVDFFLGRSLLPKYELPIGVSPDSYLEERALEGLKAKFRGSPPQNYIDRLKMELSVIKKMGYSSYFLIVWDFINYARKNNIPVGPGRGSAAGSLVAYCLDITQIDPIKYNLLFERFLNPERISMPDIDVDFCKDKRGKVINYVSEKYGADHVAQIITFGTMAAKAAIRDVGRVLGIPYAEVDKIAKLVPANNICIEDALKIEPQLKELYDKNPTVKELLDIAKRLEGLSRHASTHAAGVVIAPSPLTDFTALFKNPSEDTITTQFDMESIESVGLLKFDFLGLKTLTILEKTLEFLKQHQKEINLSEIPLDDEATFRLLSLGETTGVFQIESPGMRDILIRMQPNRFEDLIALIALYRPGPMAWIDDFIKRKKGETKVEYEIPQLKEILDETYGIILYQEQVMMIANKIANFSMGQADILRRAMGKKNQEEMQVQKDIFVKGAVSNGFSEEKARRLFEIMEPFARYGFNKSHSAAYAYLAYQTAYLKAHYPVEFMAANLSADMGDTSRIEKLINECKNMSIAILPPDINESQREFKIVGNSIRFGLEAVKGVGASAIENILHERQKGSFKSFEDFMSRVDNKKVNKKVIESLIKAGAFDSLYSEGKLIARAKAINALQLPLKVKSSSPKLFGEDDTCSLTTTLDETIMLCYEKEALGFYISGHPLTKYRKILSSMDAIKLSEIDAKEERADITTSGIITHLKCKAKEKGITAYLQLEDEDGNCEIIVFSELYKKCINLLKKGNMVIVKGQVFKSEKGIKIIARDIKNLIDLAHNTKYEVSMYVDSLSDATEKFKTIKKFMTGINNSKESLSFKLCLPEYHVIIASQLQPTSNFIEEVEKLSGVSIKVSSYFS